MNMSPESAQYLATVQQSAGDPWSKRKCGLVEHIIAWHCCITAVKLYCMLYYLARWHTSFQKITCSCCCMCYSQRPILK